MNKRCFLGWLVAAVPIAKISIAKIFASRRAIGKVIILQSPLVLRNGDFFLRCIFYKSRDFVGDVMIYAPFETNYVFAYNIVKFSPPPHPAWS